MATKQFSGFAAFAAGAVVFASASSSIHSNAVQPETHSAPASATNEPDTALVRAAAQAKLAAAERICLMFHDRESGAPRGGVGTEANYLWSKRRMMAELELFRLNPTRGVEADAIRRHLEWMRAWNKRVVESGAFAPYDIATTEYYIAEAEALLVSTERP